MPMPSWASLHHMREIARPLGGTFYVMCQVSNSLLPLAGEFPVIWRFSPSLKILAIRLWCGRNCLITLGNETWQHI